MTMESYFFDEPLLMFGNNQKLEHPQDGLFLYGPVKTKGVPSSIHVGLIGTRDGNSLIKNWLKEITGPISVENRDQLHTSPWPGFEAAFGVPLVAEPLAMISLSGVDIANAIGKTNR